MSKAPVIAEKGKVTPDAVTLFVNTLIYSGWEDVQITRELNTAAGDFQLRLTDKWKADQESWTIQSGDAVHIHMGKQSVLTGWVDSINPSFSATTRSIMLSGRSKTADFVDCSVTGANKYNDINLQDLAKKICAPFNIPVTFKTSPGANFATVTINPGETVFAVLDRLARQRKLIMIANYEGGLEFVQVGGVRATTELKLGVNVLSGSAISDKSNRFSQYTVKGQNLTSDEIEPTLGTAPTGVFIDEGVGRFRPLVLINNGTTDDKIAGDRAQYEANIRAAKSLQAQVEVQGWYKADGKLWEINEEVFCDVGYLGIRQWMLISKVVFIKNASGTTTSLSLIRKDAYDFTFKNKKIKKEEDLSWIRAGNIYKVPGVFERQGTSQ